MPEAGAHHCCPTPTFSLKLSPLSQHFYFFFLYLLNSKMKSAVMAVACAAGAQAFVAPRSVSFELSYSCSYGVVDLSPRPRLPNNLVSVSSVCWQDKPGALGAKQQFDKRDCFALWSLVCLSSPKATVAQALSVVSMWLYCRQLALC